MTRRAATAQLGFDALLADADTENRTRELDRASAHLPDTLNAALPVYRGMIERHHALMVAGNHDEALALQQEAHLLAEKLNHYEPGIIADGLAPGSVLERVTRAPKGRVPLWGQTGSFEITCRGIRIRIDIEGMFGLCSCHCPWPGFSAHAVEYDKPFISETGYRSFLGLYGELPPGQTPDRFALAVIEAHIQHELKGKLLAIEAKYRNQRR